PKQPSPARAVAATPPSAAPPQTACAGTSASRARPDPRAAPGWADLPGNGADPRRALPRWHSAWRAVSVSISSKSFPDRAATSAAAAAEARGLESVPAPRYRARWLLGTAVGP